MFRPSPHDLARDLASFLDDVFRNGGYVLSGTDLRVQGSPEGGDFADAVFLAHSVNEFSRPFWPNTQSTPAVDAAAGASVSRDPCVQPAGTRLEGHPDSSAVARDDLLCIDPNGTLLDALTMYRDTKREISAWRADATGFVASNPPPGSLAMFVTAWQTSRPVGP
jgi:DNA helicase-2/ATP-dependent DNA helicase PcrA